MSILNQFKPEFWRQGKTTTEVGRQMFNYRLIWQKAILIISIVTLLPLIIITLVDYNVTQRSIKSDNLLRALRVSSNTRRSISFFLQERVAALSFVVRDNSAEDLQQPQKLGEILANLRESFNGFVDLGIVDQSGLQVAYVGPYNLQGKDYSEQKWFRNLPTSPHYISEVFLGFRNTPHLIIGVKHQHPDGSFFVLRAAIDTRRFNELLRQLELSGNGDAFLINHSGVIQTPTLKHGDVFAQFPYPTPAYSEHTEIREQLDSNKRPLLICSAYIPESPYILIIVKDLDELMKPWHETRLVLIIFLSASITIILLVILGVSTYMVNNLYRVDQRRLGTLHQAEYANKLASIGRLAAGVAHEVNNPLAIINEKTGLAKDLITYGKGSDKDPRIIELLDSVLASVERCGRITKRLLSFARHLDSEITELQPDKVISEVLGFLHKEAEYRNISVKIDIEEGIPPIVSDRGKLQQIFLNIINNAFAAMSIGGHLEVSLAKEKDWVLISITDDGCGMAQEELGKIFEPFYSTKNKSGGTGLGLSITYGLIQELGGQIAVSSKIGEGTSFKIRLPLQTAKLSKE